MITKHGNVSKTYCKLANLTVFEKLFYNFKHNNIKGDKCLKFSQFYLILLSTFILSNKFILHVQKLKKFYF